MSDNSDFQQQLTVLNGMLEKTCEGPERDELLSLKNNIEELLALTAGSAGNDEDDKNKSNTYNDALDEEYALFMAEISTENGPEVPKTASDIKIKELEGKKFRAPYKHSWGQTVYHNAMVCSVPENEDAADDFKVKVMFLNPTHVDMLPCPYYLDIEKDCRFSEAECKFSHGELVPYSSLQDYIEPKFQHLRKGNDVLAKQPDGLWYRGKIEELCDDKCVIRYDSKNIKNERFEELSLEHILPLQESCDSAEDESDEDSDESDEKIEDDSINAAKEHRDNLINRSLMITPGPVPLGEWEQHTKGIGSKLMQKMGYIVGTGLGRDGEGIVTPVSAQVLPKGKSLDFCMNLKEQHNNPNLFQAGNKVPRRIKKLKYTKPRYNIKKKIDIKDMTLDQFIMWYFFRSKVPVEEKESQLLREKLKVASLNDLNKAKFKIDERIKTITEAIAYLKTSIQRLGTHTGHLDFVQKLALRENDLKRLKNFKLLSQNESDRRKNNKQMSVF